MDSDSDVYADDLSQISSDAEFPDSDSESDEELFRPTRNRVLPIPSSSDSEDSDDEVLDWSTTDKVPIIEQFLGQSGVFVMPHNSESVIDVVKLFIADDFFEYMATETNRYRAQNPDAFRDRAKSVKWKDVNVVDLKQMLGLLLLMGRVRKDTRDEYWSTDKTIQTPIFAEIMSRDRFRLIWYAWHFSNNDDRDGRDRLKKIRPILSYFTNKFQEVYKPERELSLDESIMPWRGRLSFKVYNASKIIKYGLLIRMVCEAKTGYICNFRMYCGVGSRLQDTILNLLKPYCNLWHHIYMDNYYNSVATCEILLQNSFRTCGTIRVNRGLPSCLKNPKLAREESIFRRR
ncbi:piggyBac transposable element-derived protein 4 [Teleopsis dalmanni]|uniref:piggyBac transposable element-derived protein 4 n=1 Tax=Teleopsis dalmanni TaxID=139649 RepID=UPI0018CF0828|nr:piggyBac transposable element-derived protein 4 [Teleopsis dalmanni]